MTDPALTPPRSQSAPPNSSPRPRLGKRTVILFTILCAVVTVLATRALLRNDVSTGVAELSAVLALLAFGLMVYGLLRIILSVIESAGERRRQAREVTERRQGDRARKPR